MMRRGPSLIGVAARTAVVAGTATAVSGRVGRKQAAKAEAAQASEPVAAPIAAPVAEAAPEENPAVAKLKELSALNASGILTDEEFAAAKAKVLAEM